MAKGGYELSRGELWEVAFRLSSRTVVMTARGQPGLSDYKYVYMLLFGIHTQARTHTHRYPRTH